jgi:alpha-beta hydrolase superfamily lysophospholipase
VLGAEALLHKDGDGFDGLILNTPNLLVQVAHLDGEPMELIKEAAEEDPLKTIAWPFKPLKDASFLVGYVQDELQFVGPHYGKTFLENIEIPKHIQDNYPNIKVPVMMAVAGEDSVLNNEVMVKLVKEQISTPEDLRELKVYEGQDHYLLVDGWKYEEVIQDEISFLNRVLTQQ